MGLAGASSRGGRQVRFFAWDVGVLGAGIERVRPSPFLACAGDTRPHLYSRFPVYTTRPQPLLTIRHDLCPVTVELEKICPVPTMVS